MTALFRLPLLRRATLAAGLALSIGAATAATPYDTWAKLNGLKDATADPRANPDGDRFPNVLEYTFGTDPLVPEKNYAVAPALEQQGDKLRFVYRVSGESVGDAKFRVLKSTDTKNWSTAPGVVERIGTDGDQVTYALPVPSDSKDAFYRLEVSVPYSSTVQEAGKTLGEGPALLVTIQVGTNAGSAWVGLPVISSVVIRQEQPKTAWKSADDHTMVPNTAKYPGLAGGSQSAFTEYLLNDYKTAGKRPPLRSWLGWFVWGNGTPPPGINPGISLNITGYPGPTGYGSYDSTKPWDYFNFQWKQTGAQASSGREDGTWSPIRVDQQPLYLTPLTVGYNWAPGLFGYESQPFSSFPNNAFYWKDKQIVRGMNISGSVPFFYQYGNKAVSPVPEVWQQAWMYLATRPLETTVIVPSNLKPDDLLEPGPWNKSDKPGLVNDPFPYPVWDTSSPASVQTPYAIQVDKVGDWHADLIWEAARKSAGEDPTPYYKDHRYQRSAFNQPGSGNYMKATVAQGSPFVWCETNGNRYAIFYNLIRTNLRYQINNNTGTGARMVRDVPWDVPGVSGVKFVLLYGDQVNPNQWHQEVEPWYADLGGGTTDSQMPGGFNPPPGTWNFQNGAGDVTVPGQHNHTYTAIFYREEAVASTSSGEDTQKNPYFYLQFKNPGKNWFVVGSVPEMRYYNTTTIPDDKKEIRDRAAIAWAEEMGKYAFNFPVASKIDYSVTNMYQTTTNFKVDLKNPFASVNGGEATSIPNKTVMALSPHQYQPTTLGPDYAKAGAPPVVWNPLRNYGQDFPIPVSAPPNANKNQYKVGASTFTTPSRWGYWSLGGNLKTIIGNGFTTVYPFQNFLPVMPPPDYSKTFKQSGIAGVNITLDPTGTPYTQIVDPPVVSIEQADPPGSGGQLTAHVANETIDKIDVTAKGALYPKGTPPATWKVVISGGGGTGAAAHINVVEANGEIADVTMDNVGSGYTSTPTVTLEKNLGTGATFVALVDKNTGKVQQVDVVNGGGGYPDGLPPDDVQIKIAPPDKVPAEYRKTATAYAQISGGQVLAVFMTDNGAGYSSTLSLWQDDGNGGKFYGTPPAVVIPNFDTGNPPALIPGSAVIVEAGGGFDFSKEIHADIIGTGTKGTASVVLPGTIVKISTSDQIAGPGGFSAPGFYPSASGTPAPGTVAVYVPPPPAPVPPPSPTPLPAQTAEPQWSAKPSDTSFSAAIFSKGTGYTGGNWDKAHVTIEGTDYPVQVTVDSAGAVTNIAVPPVDPPDHPSSPTYPLTGPVDVVFDSAGTGADARIYPVYLMTGVQTTAPRAGGYVTDQQVEFGSADIYPADKVTKPEITFTIPPSGVIGVSDLHIVSGGSGFNYKIDQFVIRGGHGFDALLAPVAQDGKIKAVKVLRGGSHYPDQVSAFAATGGTPAQFEVTVKDGSIAGVKVTNEGSGYGAQPLVVLLKPPPWSAPTAPDPVSSDNPKGLSTAFIAKVTGGAISGFELIPLPVAPVNAPTVYERAIYIPGTEDKATIDSVPAQIQWMTATPFAKTQPSTQYLAAVAPAETKTDQVLYSSLIAQYQKLASMSSAPFGGSFIGIPDPAGQAGAAAPDGYGLGGQLAASSKYLGDLFNFQQHVETTGTEPLPSQYAYTAGTTVPAAFEFPDLQKNSPYVSMSLGLQSSVQAMQRAITDLFVDPPSHNSPLKSSPNTWSEDYYSIYDDGRLLINPTQSQPVWGVLSSVQNPAFIPTTIPPPSPSPSPAPTPAYENDAKTLLSKWQPGMLWSGFGVSDQWNDQHYFYGYYLSTAALAGIFDQAWLPVNQIAKSANLWAGQNQMGTAIDQMLLTLANDPDNASLQSSLYKVSTFTYQKFAFFDQWAGHPWATGAQPGSTGSALLPVSPVAGTGADPYAFWKSHGTDNDKYNGENENSAFEGLQAWSATILWGAATDRKAVVDLGIYLYSTGLAAADAYFLDKNYNLANSADNKFSWVPVTTIDASVLKPKLAGYNDFKAGQSYVDGNPAAFYTAPEALGGAASAGQSLMKKAEVTNNNYFYAYPTGTKFIQAYPPTPWTLGIARDTKYMHKWAGAMMSQAWTDARNSSLYLAADWNAMALTSALCGVPYNPGDKPYPPTGGNIDTPTGLTMVQQLWSSWVTRDQSAGSNAALNPPFTPTSVLSFLLAFDNYGEPDWTYLAKVTLADGTTEDNAGVVFTAAFTKRPIASATEVHTTFVAFNPGWTKRYVKFYRLDAAGNMTGAGSTLIAIEPKRMAIVPATFTIEP